MDKYGYLWISVILFIPWLLLFYYHKNLRRRMVLSGLIFAPFGTLNLWFKQDYWNAPEVYIFFSVISIDDILFAFITTGIGVAIFDALFTEKQVKQEKSRINILWISLIIVMISWYILREVIGINSMFMFAIPVLISTVIFIIIRKDLLIPSLITTLITTGIAIITYIILFNYLLPKFWSTYWFLWGKEYGWTIFGNVPVLEVLWYFSWSSLAAVLYDFGKGTKKIPNNRWKKLTNS